MPGEYAPRGCEPPTASLLMGQPLAYERGEGAWGNREVPPHRVVRRGLVGETWWRSCRLCGSQRSLVARDRASQAVSASTGRCSEGGTTRAAAERPSISTSRFEKTAATCVATLSVQAQIARALPTRTQGDP